MRWTAIIVAIPSLVLIGIAPVQAEPVTYTIKAAGAAVQYTYVIYKDVGGYLSGTGIPWQVPGRAEFTITFTGDSSNTSNVGSGRLLTNASTTVYVKAEGFESKIIPFDSSDLYFSNDGRVYVDGP
jgi:hypothetical protein